MGCFGCFFNRLVVLVVFSRVLIANRCTTSLAYFFPFSAYILVPFLISVYVFDNKLHRHTHGRHRVETRLLTLEYIPTNDIHYLADRIARQVAYGVPPRSVKDKTIILLIHCFDVKKRPRGGCDISDMSSASYIRRSAIKDVLRYRLGYPTPILTSLSAYLCEVVPTLFILLSLPQVFSVIQVLGFRPTCFPTFIHTFGSPLHGLSKQPLYCLIPCRRLIS